MWNNNGFGGGGCCWIIILIIILCCCCGGSGCGGRPLPEQLVLPGGQRAAFQSPLQTRGIVIHPRRAVAQGPQQQLLAAGFPDCWGAARALRSLGLFRGTGSGVGEGLDLRRRPGPRSGTAPVPAAARQRSVVFS